MKRKLIMTSILAFLFTVTNVSAANFAEELISKANGVEVENYEDGNTDEMYTFEHEKTEQTDELTDYRYLIYGRNNNVYFNCTDENDTSTCQRWEIIGVFDVENENGDIEKRVKLIGPTIKCGAVYWGSPDWPNAILKKDLNGEVDSCFNFTDSAKAMTGDSKYYLGGINSDDKSADDFYKAERGTDVNGDNATNWVGKVALMYASDYAYIYALGIDEACFTNTFDCSKSNWLLVEKADYWVLNQRNNGSNLRVRFHGFLADVNGAAYRARPVLYLKADTYLLDGDGSSQSPYQITLTEKKDEEPKEEETEEPTEEPKEEPNSNQNSNDISSKPEINNPETSDSSIIYIILLVIGLVGFTAGTFKLKKSVK